MRKSLCRFIKKCVIWTLILSCSALSSCFDTQSNDTEQISKITIREMSAVAQESPTVSAKAAIGIEGSSGEIFYAKNIDEQLPMASTTKIMTAIVALERGNVSDNVKIDKAAVGIEGSSIYLYEGEILTLENLLYALLLESANDAAAAIAIHIGGSIEAFVAMMNEKADELGLTNTHFDNPHGLDGDTHYTTARELGIIAAYAMKNETFKQIVGTYKTTIPLANGEGTRVLINHNKLLRNYDGAIGIKTGYTKKSGRCLTSAAMRDGVELICITLCAPSDWQDHESILDFGYSIYERKTLAEAGESPITLPVINGIKSEISLQIPNDIKVTALRNTEIQTVIEAPRFVFAPITKNASVGKIIFLQNGNIIAESPLIATESITKANNKTGLFGFFKK